MDIKEIQELIKFVAKSGATEVDLEIDNVKISIKSPPKKRRGENSEEAVQIINQAQPVAISQEKIITQPVAQNIIVEKNETKTQSTSETDDSRYITINASMIGTFYRSSSPDNPPFANVGDKIKEGDALCIIEAMKLFNEIEAEVSGTIVKVLVDDATPIEFDQPLFLIDPV
tara:strand:+ start:20045 stop:20560 length:516 start_codon:yes stop_codon:yes gene_type:complete